MTSTDPQTFHAALQALLAQHGVEASIGPRRTADGLPADDVEGLQYGDFRVKVTSLSLFFLRPREMQRQAWFGALMGLPGVLPYPVAADNPLGGSTVVIRWLDGSELPARPLAPL